MLSQIANIAIDEEIERKYLNEKFIITNELVKKRLKNTQLDGRVKNEDILDMTLLCLVLRFQCKVPDPTITRRN